MLSFEQKDWTGMIISVDKLIVIRFATSWSYNRRDNSCKIIRKREIIKLWKDSNENKRVTCTCIRNVLTKLNQGDPIVQCLVNSMASQHLHKKEGTKQALTAISTIPRIPPIQTATTGFVTVIQLTTDLLSRELCFRLDSKSSPPPLFYFTECLTFHCLFLSFMSGHVWNVLKLLITFLFFFFFTEIA